ncbi:UNVERIFIED_CONTAM: hypothetical protein HDU68_007165 [Siphonaria sp. JEL0065]|nr:hypothetical protein HDU68_007165 [Siphonaria sp. JEL0065]
MNVQMTTVLCLGSTGFIGGTVLTTLQSTLPTSFHITALIRSDPEGLRLKTLSESGCHSVLTFSGLDASSELTDICSRFDVVVNVADACDHLESAKAIVAGLKLAKEHGKLGILIHTSGTGVIMDNGLGAPSDIVYSDTDYTLISQLDPAQPHRDVDLFIAQADDNITTVTVVPPLVYGEGTGRFKTWSSQVPGLIHRAIKSGKAEFIGAGQGKWNHVHVQDLARVFAILVERVVLDPESVESGARGYVFAESGELTWKELAQGVADAIKRTGQVELVTYEAVSLDAEETKDQFPNELGRAYYSSNSRSRAVKAREWGWEPVVGNKHPLFQDLDREVLVQLKLHK